MCRQAPAAGDSLLEVARQERSYRSGGGGVVDGAAPPRKPANAEVKE
jgi:hypothetical protein